jgi:hypothetical protein
MFVFKMFFKLTQFRWEQSLCALFGASITLKEFSMFTCGGDRIFSAKDTPSHLPGLTMEHDCFEEGKSLD